MKAADQQAIEAQHGLLRETLRLAVPLHLDEMRDLPADTLLAIASAAADTVGCHGAHRAGRRHLVRPALVPDPRVRRLRRHRRPRGRVPQPATRRRSAARHHRPARHRHLPGRLLMPTRIQRRRTAGWRAPLDAAGRPPVYVGRGSRWGNPYRLGDTQVRMPGIDGSEWELEGRIGKVSGQRHHFVHPDRTVTWHLVQDATPAQVVELYRRWLAKRPDLVAAVRAELAGRDLMCWCPTPKPGQPDHCHGALLLRLAAGEPL